MHNAAYRCSIGIFQMSEWLNALIFGAALVTFVLGLSSIIMGFMVSVDTPNPMAKRIEYGYLGVSSIVLCSLMVYLLS